MGRWGIRRGSVPASPRRRRLETLRALVTEKVVPGEDVVDLKALGASVAFADVALQEGLVVVASARGDYGFQLFGREANVAEQIPYDL